MYVPLDYDEISVRILCSVYIDTKEQMFYNMLKEFRSGVAERSSK